MDPGDSALRNDVQMLSDAGVIHAPLTSWPLAWADVARDLKDVDDHLSPYLVEARQRVLRRYRRESRINDFSPHLRIAAADHPRQLRTFADTARESGELEAGADWTGSTFAYRLQMTAVDAPDDGRQFRFDGSYAAAILGNWAFSASEQSRWWGPGWDGSLILSNNARPIPSITVQRHMSDPFATKWLHWLGPWQFLFTLGQLEGNRDIPHAKFLGMRLNFRPIPSLEIGASRTAQWGGQGRPQDLSAFTDILLGRDNLGSNGINRANEPGNQLAGFDFRWQSPLFKAPYAVYGQAIGEDEAGGWPSRYTGLFGIETWGPWGRHGASWRLHAEYADTATGGFYSSNPQFNYAYQHHIYTSGYTYYGRVIGDSLGGDGRILSVGLLVMDRRDREWEVLLRHSEPNRDQLNVTESAVELAHRFQWAGQDIALRGAVVRSHDQTLGNTDTEEQIELQWRRDFE